MGMSERLKHGGWRKLSDTKAMEAKRLYESGLSIQKVAERMGVSRQSMHGTLKRMGTTFRPQKRFGESNHFYRGGKMASDKAQNKLERAIQRGEITRPETCEECGMKPPPFTDGRTPIQAHHDDYSKPLEVRWLCQRCHHKHHKETMVA